jgi:arylsulfatase A-like enzyme
MKAIVTLAAAALLLMAAIRCVAAEDGSRPNVLFVMSDDHCSQALSAYGGRLASACRTPNIDRLAQEGIRFDNCFVTNSICTPSRAAIFTGKYAHKNGVYKFTALNQAQPTLPKMMRRAGYRTAIIGKYHLHSNPVGFDFWSILPGQGEYHDPEFIEMGDESPSGWLRNGERTGYRGHCTDVIASKAIDALRDLGRSDQPFLLFCHFKAPHDTWEYAERYDEFLVGVDIPEPPNLFDDYEGRSDMLRKQLQYIGSEWGNHTNFKEETAHLRGSARKKRQYQLYLKKYLRCVKGVDDNVGRILDYLDESGLAKNTVVVYTADQGFFLGEHGLYDKRIMYEEALRMPLLVRWPGRVRAGSVSDDMVLNVDFAPTILEIAGAEPHSGMQGRSLLQLLEGRRPDDWRTSMYYRYYRSHFETEAHFGVRTRTHKLIYFDDIDQWEMYDLRRDPTEMHNLANNPAHRDKFNQLKAELFRLQAELGDDPDNKGDRPDIGEQNLRRSSRV